MGEKSGSARRSARLNAGVLPLEGSVAIRKGHAGFDAAAALAILALLPLTLLAVDRTPRVLWASPRARRVLQAGDGLSVDGEGRLVSTNAQAEIEPLLSSAERGREAAIAMACSSRPGSLFVRCMRLPGASDLFLLQLTDRDEPPPIHAGIARQIFALTAVEAKLAALVAEGAPLGRAAASLRISPGTARNHLKSIFRKTGVRRQSDLVRLLLVTAEAWEPPA